MIAEFEARIKELGTAVEQSVMNHHALLGRLGEAKHTLEQYLIKKGSDFIAEKVDEAFPAVDQTAVAQTVSVIAESAADKLL